jgi:hypothetical protein
MCGKMITSLNGKSGTRLVALLSLPEPLAVPLDAFFSLLTRTSRSRSSTFLGLNTSPKAGLKYNYNTGTQGLQTTQ